MTRQSKLLAKKAKRKANVDKYLLETSVQIGKFKPNSKSKKFVEQSSPLYSSHFCLYEFKSGFIRSLIDYYFLVEITGTPADAMAQWSDRYKIRELKNVLLMTSMTMQLNASISASSKEDYLSQIEAAIYHFVNNFDTDIVALVGEFSRDEIVKFDLNAMDQFRPFVQKLTDRKSVIRLDKFWTDHKAEFDLLLAKEEAFKSEALKKIYAKLTVIQADVSKVNKPMINRGIGDAIIAVDSLGSMILTSLDHSFATMAPILSKKSLII